MSKVFIVTSGSYSDYSIDAVFSTEEKAKEYLQLWCEKFGETSFDDTKIKVFELDEPVVKENGYYNVGSNTNSIEVAYASYWWSESDTPNSSKENLNRVESHKFLDGDFVYRVNVLADSHDRAVKIAADLFREFKALNPS